MEGESELFQAYKIPAQGSLDNTAANVVDRCRGDRKGETLFPVTQLNCWVYGSRWTDCSAVALNQSKETAGLDCDQGQGEGLLFSLVGTVY